MCFYFWRSKKALQDEDYLDMKSYIVNEDECAICLDPLNTDICVQKRNCGHIFHHKCYIEYINSYKTKQKKVVCPYCNTF